MRASKERIYLRRRIGSHLRRRLPADSEVPPLVGLVREASDGQWAERAPQERTPVHGKQQREAALTVSAPHVAGAILG
jgi:hypothetical protein